MPASDFLVAAFLASQAGKVAHARHLWSAVEFWHLVNNAPMSLGPLCKCVLRGVERLAPASLHRPLRPPVSIEHLDALKDGLNVGCRSTPQCTPRLPLPSGHCVVSENSSHHPLSIRSTTSRDQLLISQSSHCSGHEDVGCDSHSPHSLRQSRLRAGSRPADRGPQGQCVANGGARFPHACQ
jgi:hypothetical protein